MTTEHLDAIKREFYRALLDDTVLTLLILNALDDTTATDLPNFRAEPWRPRSEDSTQALGIRFTRSLTGTVEKLDELAVPFGAFHYLTVLTTTKERTEATMIIGGDNKLFIEGSTALRELDTAEDMRRQGALWFMQQWQKTLKEAYELGAVIDLMTGTLTMDPPSYVQ